jgi:ATP-binding cassette, subfamily G (WHITE), eye pigment precursor transporter
VVAGNEAGINVKVANGRRMKQILTQSNGFAKPKEMMAIMGASGSGKTSLLNVLAQRMALSPGYTLNGEVRCNNRVVDSNDFGKIGAFV